MRIIDKNTDFYDYYQDIYKDDTLVFDRRDSFLLTKELMCTYLTVPRYWTWKTKRYEPDRHTYALLQIGHTYWLFLINMTKINQYDRVEDYEIEFMAKWHNYNKPRQLCNLDIIDFYYSIRTKSKVEVLVNEINTNNHKIKKSINKFTIYNGDKKVEKHIPLLKACGIANCVDALDIYLAFEEYFSLEKTASERREPIGTTDIDKVESHGFDKKISFRGVK